MVIMSGRAMSLMAHVRRSLPPNVHIRLTPRGGYMSKELNQL